jgi:hypothetical protein
VSATLQRALGADRATVERGLRAAHQQLLGLTEQVRELELLTAQARSILDLAGTWIPWPPLPAPPRPPTLHEAMAQVLTAHRNAWMSPSYIAREIARRGLYRRRDGLPATPRDVSARVSTYPGWFVRDGWYVRLRAAPPGTSRKDHRYLPRFEPWPPPDQAPRPSRSSHLARIASAAPLSAPSSSSFKSSSTISSTPPFPSRAGTPT